MHPTRVRHPNITKDLPFAEYRKQLDDEIAPALHMLEEMKKANAKEMVNSIKE